VPNSSHISRLLSLFTSILTVCYHDIYNVAVSVFYSHVLFNHDLLYTSLLLSSRSEIVIGESVPDSSYTCRLVLLFTTVFTVGYHNIYSVAVLVSYSHLLFYYDLLDIISRLSSESRSVYRYNRT
jgi:hypothetical protein